MAAASKGLRDCCAVVASPAASTTLAKHENDQTFRGISNRCLPVSRGPILAPSPHEMQAGGKSLDPEP